MLFRRYVARLLQESTSAHIKSRKQVQPAPPAPVLQPGRTGVDLLDNPAVGVIKSLNRYTVHLIPLSDTAGTELSVMFVLMPDDGLVPSLSSCQTISRFCKIQDVAAEPDERGTPAAGKNCTCNLFVTELCCKINNCQVQKDDEMGFKSYI